MLRLAICDDDEKDLKMVELLTKNLLESLNLEYEIEKFTDGKSLLESIISFDILLLDIEMNNMNGIEIARNIRTNNRVSKIVFITNSRDYLQVGYTVKADGYFMKPINKTEFDYEITNILKENIFDSKFIFDKRAAPYKIYLKDIIYIEFFDRKTIINMKKGKISTFLTLREWMNLLNNYNFTHSHKAYIINLRYVSELKTDSIIMITGEELLLSRKYKNDFKNLYYASLGEWF